MPATPTSWSSTSRVAGAVEELVEHEAGVGRLLRTSARSALPRASFLVFGNVGAATT